jgi:hypothetical protein
MREAVGAVVVVVVVVAAAAAAVVFLLLLSLLISYHDTTTTRATRGTTANTTATRLGTRHNYTVHVAAQRQCIAFGQISGAPSLCARHGLLDGRGRVQRKPAASETQRRVEKGRQSSI